MRIRTKGANPLLINRKHLLHKQHHCFFLLAILLAFTNINADTITMHDGSTRTGTIVSENNGVIQFSDPSFGNLQIPRNQIKSISRDTSATGPSNGTDLVAHAEAEKNRGDLAAALNSYIQAAKASITPELVQQFHGAFTQLSQQADSQLSSTPDKARESYKALYAALAEPVAQDLFSQGSGHITYQKAATEVTAKYAQANANLAQRMSTNMQMRAQVQSL